MYFVLFSVAIRAQVGGLSQAPFSYMLLPCCEWRNLQLDMVVTASSLADESFDFEESSARHQKRKTIRGADMKFAIILVAVWAAVFEVNPGYQEPVYKDPGYQDLKKELNSYGSGASPLLSEVVLMATTFDMQKERSWWISRPRFLASTASPMSGANSDFGWSLLQLSWALTRRWQHA